MIAYAYASGQIGFAPKLPSGALPVANGAESTIRPVISGLARHAYDGETLLIPGVPEAADEMAALDALLAFRARVEVALRRVAAAGKVA